MTVLVFKLKVDYGGKLKKAWVTAGGKGKEYHFMGFGEAPTLEQAIFDAKATALQDIADAIQKGSLNEVDVIVFERE